ncbi:MAG TPA: hypothetical protein ENN46_01975 [Candidatus Woesearchaeota archaeon]|nr:hypothetical protein [Candidatus Woesearchaeota archaeon]
MDGFSLEMALFFVFILIMGAFLFFKRKRLTIEWVLKPVIYLMLYKTKLGIGFIDFLAKKAGGLIRIIGYLFAVAGIAIMPLITWLLAKSFYDMAVAPGSVPGVGLVLPIPIKGVFYVPFSFWIISLFIIMIFHEFSHGIVAKAHKVPIKSSGFAFFGILAPLIPAAFVEPDEKIIKKAKTSTKLSIFAAGPVMNIVLGIVIVMFIFPLAVTPIQEEGLDFYFDIFGGSGIVNVTGVKVAGYMNFSEEPYAEYNLTSPAKLVGIPVNSTIQEINGVRIKTINDISRALEMAENTVTVTADGENYAFVPVNHPTEERKLLGIVPALEYTEATGEKYIAYGFLLTLLTWLWLLNIGIGAFNLLPINILDGGQMLKAILDRIISEESSKRIVSMFSWGFGIMLIIMILMSFLF